MATTLASLAINLSANSAQMVTEIRNVRRGFGDLASHAKSLAVAVGGASTAFTAFALAQAGSVAETKKWADQLGVSTQRMLELSSAFSNNANIDADQFKDTLQELNVRLGEAAVTGGGALVDAFAAIGLKVEEIRRLKTDQMILEIADAFEALDDKQQLAFISEEIFAGEAAKMVKVLEQGSGAINQMTSEYREMNGVLTDTQALDMAEAARSANQLMSAFSGLGRELVALTSGPGSAFLNWLTESVKKMRNASQVLKKMFVTNEIEDINEKIAENIRIIDKYEGRAPDDHWWSKMAANARKRIEELNKELEVLQGKTQKLLTPDGPGSAFVDDGMNDHVKTWKDANREAVKAAAERKRIQDEADEAKQNQITDLFGGDPQSRMAALEESLMGEYDLLHAHTRQKLDMINAARNEDIISQKKAEDLKLKLMRNASIQAQKIEQNKNNNIVKWQETFNADMKKTATSLWGFLTARNKNFAIAEAVVLAGLGVARSLAAYPFPFNLAAAAAHAALGYAQVDAIRSGSGGFGGGGGSVPSVPTVEGVTELAANDDEPTTKTITVAIEGDGELLPRSVLRELADELNSLDDSNVRISV